MTAIQLCTLTLCAALTVATQSAASEICDAVDAQFQLLKKHTLAPAEVKSKQLIIKEPLSGFENCVIAYNEMDDAINLFCKYEVDLPSSTADASALIEAQDLFLQDTFAGINQCYPSKRGDPEEVFGWGGTPDHLSVASVISVQGREKLGLGIAGLLTSEPGAKSYTAKLAMFYYKAD